MYNKSNNKITELRTNERNIKKIKKKTINYISVYKLISFKNFKTVSPATL